MFKKLLVLRLFLLYYYAFCPLSSSYICVIGKSHLFLENWRACCSLPTPSCQGLLGLCILCYGALERRWFFLLVEHVCFSKILMIWMIYSYTLVPVAYIYQRRKFPKTHGMFCYEYKHLKMLYSLFEICILLLCLNKSF